MNCTVAGFLDEDTVLKQARHRWKAVPWIALAVLGLVAAQQAARGETAASSASVDCRALGSAPYRCEALLTQGQPIQPAVSLPPEKPAGASEGCPSGTFKPLFKAGCAKPSADSKLSADDGEPMRFGAIQLSKSIAFLQAIGTITRETPAEFARFMATDGARTSIDLNIHSPGGDPLAGMELGRAIRKARLNTSIERSIPLEGAMRVYRYKAPVCASACAYAFLGGVSRSYSADARYSLHSPPSKEAALYLEEMGIDPRLQQAASSMTTQNDAFVVPDTLGKEWRVIFDASGLTTFTVKERSGKTVATFNFTDRGHKFGGVLFCDQGHRAMAVVDTEDSVHPVLRFMNEFPAEFEASGRKIEGTATYVGKTEQSPALIVFHLPSLDERSFSGSGLVLTRLTNPQLSSSGGSVGGAGVANRGLLDALSWGDAESAILFRIAADNGGRTLPSVFKDCR